MSSVTPGKLVTPDTSTFTNANNIATTTTGSNGKYLDNNIKITKANSDGSLATITNTTINGETVSLLDGEKIVSLENLNFTPITTEDTSLPGKIKLTKENLPGNVAYINQTDKFLDSSVKVKADQLEPKLIVANTDTAINEAFPNQLEGSISVNVNQILGLTDISDQATIEANVKESIVNDTDFISGIADSVEAEIATGANVVTLDGEQTITGSKIFDGKLYTDSLSSPGDGNSAFNTTYLSVSQIGSSNNLHDRMLDINAGQNELSILPGNIDLKAPIKNSLNLCDLDKYSEYPNKNSVKGLYIYAIVPLYYGATETGNSISYIYAQVYFTNSRKAFLDNLIETNTDLTFSQTPPASDDPNVIRDIKSLEPFTNIKTKGQSLQFSAFTWNDKINQFEASYEDNDTQESNPLRENLNNDSIVIKELDSGVLNNLLKGFEGWSELEDYEWFRGMMIPSAIVTTVTTNGTTNKVTTNKLFDLSNISDVDFTTNSIAVGDNNFAGGINSLALGESNITFDRSNAAIGKGNINYGYCSGIIGRNNFLNAQNSFIAGSFNKAEAPAENGCFILGGRSSAGNIITASETVAVGFSNTINKDHTIAVGFGNNIPDTAEFRSVVLGRYAKVHDNALLTLGCGNSSTDTKNILWYDNQNKKVCFDDLPVNISTTVNISSVSNLSGTVNISGVSNLQHTVNISDLKLPKLFAGVTNRAYGNLGFASFSFGHENDPAGKNQQMLLGSWLTGVQQYSTIVGTGNSTNFTATDPVFIVGDGTQGATGNRHNAIEVGRNATGININTKTNFNSDIYVKTDQDHVAKLVFTEVNESVTISAVLVNQ